MLIIIPSADRTDNQLCARSLDLCARLHHGDHLAPVTPGDSGAVLKSPPDAKFSFTAQDRFLLLDSLGSFDETVPNTRSALSLLFSGLCIYMSHRVRQCHGDLAARMSMYRLFTNILIVQS